MTHKHKWQLASWSGSDVSFLCTSTGCTERFTRKATKKDQKVFENYLERENKYAEKLHGLWWRFKELFCPNDPYLKWKYSGYDFMERIRKFADQTPDIKIVSCDDLVNASSLIAFIPHETENELWGVDMICVPQCDGQQPAGVFLYPEHIDGLIKTLTEFKRKHKSLKRKEASFEPKFELPKS